MTQRDLFRPTPGAWNRGRIIGPKPPFKASHVWAIRQQLKVAGRVGDLALFDCGTRLRASAYTSSSLAAAPSWRQP